MTEKRHPDNTDKVLPMMSDYEVECVSYIIEQISKRLDDRKPRVLEFGSGDSTIYFTNKYEDSLDYWCAVEDHVDWHDHVSEHTPDIANCVYLEAQNYYSLPLNSDTLYDLVIVDGRYRLASMVVASQILFPYGGVLLHDSSRPHYDSVWGLFDNYEVLSEGKEASSDYLTASYEGLTLFWDDED